MAFKDDLVKARSYIIFIVGLLVAFGLVYTIETRSHIALTQAKKQDEVCEEKISKRIAAQTTTIYQIKPLETADVTISANLPTPQQPRALTSQELQMARIAWKYFQNNTRPETGLANSVDNYTASTMWDTASYLMAVISAEKIGLIKKQEFNQRISKALSTLEKMPLFDHKLPNKSYSTLTGKMVNYANKESPLGIGWSAIDIGRVLVPLNILTWNHPQHTEQVRRVVGQWKLKHIARDGQLTGASRAANQSISYPQEGRVGYEQYAAKTFALLGLDVSRALNFREFLQYVEIYGLKIPVDKRDPKIYGAQNFVVSENYMLDGIEFGFDQTSREYAWRVYQAQAARYKETGVLTAVSEDHLDQAPYFIYNTVYSGGKKWNAITEKGQDASKFRMLSSKAVFAWHALYRDAYTQKMVNTIMPLHDPNKGFYTGLYEVTKQPNKSITSNTNGIILESLAYIKTGKLMPF